MDINVALIGLGPHAKRIYLKYLKEHNINFKLLVELKSKKNDTMQYLESAGFKNVTIWTLPDEYADLAELPLRYEKELELLCKKNNITHIISSTEPKGHNMYLTFALKHSINILSDKPITVVKGMDKLQNIETVRNQYYQLLNLHKDKSCKCKVMCQRLYHRGYKYVKQILKDIVSKYNIPITYIDIYHCDGNWEMPHDLNKENHPYKYGYGKLYHSGFHFIDLLSELLKINNLTDTSKKIVSGKIYGNIFTPNDEREVFSKNDFFNIFPESKNINIYKNLDKINFNNYGEKNFYGQLNFYNSHNALITTANLNLLHYGFSRRGWLDSRDYYKKNGRVRHERVTINVGPLLTIQIQSYQSKEIKDRTNAKEETEPGGLEHFDIDIYRNVDIIGGRVHEKVKLKDLYDKDIQNDNFIGYNEKSREEFLNHYFYENDDIGNLENEQLAIEILYSCSKIVHNKYNNLEKTELIKIPKEEKESELY